MDPGWEAAFKGAAILVPVFMAIIMFGIAHIVKLVGLLQSDVVSLKVSENGMRARLEERAHIAAKDHALIDRRLDEHDDLLERHGERIGKLEARA